MQATRPECNYIHKHKIYSKYLLSESEVGVSGCDMPLETERVCAHFLLKIASSDPQIPKFSAARP